MGSCKALSQTSSGRKIEVKEEKDTLLSVTILIPLDVIRDCIMQQISQQEQ